MLLSACSQNAGNAPESSSGTSSETTTAAAPETTVSQDTSAASASSDISANTPAQTTTTDSEQTSLTGTQTPAHSDDPSQETSDQAQDTASETTDTSFELTQLPHSGTIMTSESPEQTTSSAPAQVTSDTTKQTAYVLDKSDWPIMTVNVTGSKTADITVQSKGRVYYGLSISLVDPTLPGYDRGTFFSLSLTYFKETNERWCWLKHPYPTYPVDEPDIEVPYENIGGNDYVFHVTLPASTSVTFSTINEYALWLQEDASETSFNSVGPYAAEEVTAAGSDFSETPASDLPMSEADKTRFEAAVTAVAGNYRDVKGHSLYLEGSDGSYLFWPSGFELYDKIEVYDWKENEYYDIKKSVDAGGTATVDIKCINGYNEGKSIKFVISGSTITVSCAGDTAVFDPGNKI